ncbi:CapA family protein [Candidatus Enterococcus willemsii]|uniref:Metallophosphatase n=1 Tax=Candidatus Enterococcus willemsii TaxID=1857215 RepID=A0ABQ6YX27_9ENTE|nr:CapA family protein [Enterococcus sp. CU12B]KAF1302250.1 metallophosphatase [Enterococcus sp. CU12B]
MTKRKLSRKGKKLVFGVLVGMLFLSMSYTGYFIIYKGLASQKSDETSATNETSEPNKKQGPQTITVTASGDMLYHRPLYLSSFDGENYDFDNDYEKVKPLISSADIALGDFEGTINPKREVGGFPLFNAPPTVVDSIKDAGFDVIDLAHNHILDTGIEGVVTTATTFHDAGLDTIGVNVDNDGILVKEVKGIKVAMLAYSYGFNGIEESISKKDYDKYLNDLSMDEVETDIKKAEKIADITIVMPQDGVEYALEPTEVQQTNYRKMIDSGADIIFGGHPHVAEPTEIIEKDGEKKFIIYSMGNLLSNQRFETVNNDYWTERGVIPEVEITKDGERTYLSNVTLHPTWVSREPIANHMYYDFEYGNMQAYDFQVVLAEDYLPGGKSADQVPEETRQRIETAYHEMLELLDLKWE